MFDWIWQSFANWLKSLLVSSIKDSLSSMFSNLNNQVNSIGQTVGQTPQNWNGNIFNIIQNLSQSVIMPVAGIILALVACYELIALISEKNNMQEGVFCKRCLSNKTNTRYTVSSFMVEEAVKGRETGGNNTNGSQINNTDPKKPL